MRGAEHVGVGVASAGLVVWGASSVGDPMTLTTAMGVVVATALGSLAPDIDHSRSIVGNRLPVTLLTLGLGSVLLPVVLRLSARRDGMLSGALAQLGDMTAPWAKWGGLIALLGAGLLGLSMLATRKMQHRGPTHTVAFALGATVVLLVASTLAGLSPLFAVLFGLGWVLHLVADATTPAGLQSPYWPSASRRPAQASPALLVVIALLVMGGSLGWYQVTRQIESPRAVSSPTTQAVERTVSAELARRRLEDADPSIAAALTQPDAPVVEQNGEYTSFTWDYLRQDQTDAVAVEQITVTLSQDGRLVGVQIP